LTALTAAGTATRKAGYDRHRQWLSIDTYFGVIHNREEMKRWPGPQQSEAISKNVCSPS